jgi:hypothetical protein
MAASDFEHSTSLPCCEDAEQSENMWPFLNNELPDPGLPWQFPSVCPFRLWLCWALLLRISWKISKNIFWGHVHKPWIVLNFCICLVVVVVHVDAGDCVSELQPPSPRWYEYES